jgi:hypothetical protein
MKLVAPWLTWSPLLHEFIANKKRQRSWALSCCYPENEHRREERLRQSVSQVPPLTLLFQKFFQQLREVGSVFSFERWGNKHTKPLASGHIGTWGSPVQVWWTSHIWYFWLGCSQPWWWREKAETPLSPLKVWLRGHSLFYHWLILQILAKCLVCV